MIIPLEICKIEDDLRNGYHILCRAHIRGKEFRMLVDTGASMTIFNIDKASEISENSLESNHQEVRGLGNSNIKSKFLVIDELRIGEIILKEYKTILLNLEFINEHFRKNGQPLIDGIIGGDILKEYKAVIDYENREMMLS